MRTKLKDRCSKEFFSDFGVTESALEGVNQISLSFDTGPDVRCVQSIREVAALQCFVATGQESNIHLSFGKMDGTSISMDKYVTGHFRSQVATRVTRGFSSVRPAAYLTYDIHLSLTGKRFDRPDEAASGVFEILNVPNYYVKINGIQNP